MDMNGLRDGVCRSSLVVSTVAALLAAVLAAGCGGGKTDENQTSAPTSNAGASVNAPQSPSKSSLKIAVIPKGTTHEYWKSIHAGAMKAAKELGEKGQTIEVNWQGAEKEDDREKQIQIVEQFVTQKVDGIVLAPLDKEALVTPVEQAVDAGIPVTIIDSAIDTKKIASFVATPNEKGGNLAGECLAKLLNGKGKVILMRYAVNSASTEAREKGFLDTIAKFPGISVISKDQYAGATAATAQATGEDLMARFGSQVDGIFCPNESSAIGMLKVLEQDGKAGKVKFVGFDAGQTLLDALKAGSLQGLVVQNPFNMGYLGLKTEVAAINKQSVDKVVDTGVTLITPENLNSKENQELLNPPIDQYVK